MTTDVVLSPELEAWLKRGGAVYHKIRADYLAEGWRGIVAKERLLPGDVLLEVPERLLMSCKSARRCLDLHQKLRGSTQPLNDTEVLAVHLLHELSKGQASFWAPYLRQLPCAYTNLAFFSNHHIEALQVEYAQEIAVSSAESVCCHWQACRPILTALGLPAKFKTYQAFAWASATLASRTMHIPFSSAGALMPLGDLHNYRPPPRPVLPDIEGLQGEEALEEEDAIICGDGVFDEETQMYRLCTRIRYEPGEQVFLCYGVHSNIELLEHYGFLLDSNAHDKALLPRAAFNDPVTSQPGLLPETLLPAVDCWLHTRSGVPSWQLLKAIRLAVLTPDERKAVGHLAMAGQRCSKKGDLKVFWALHDACKAVLQGLPTSIAEDEALLANDGTSSDELLQLAVRWRLGYKRVSDRTSFIILRKLPVRRICGTMAASTRALPSSIHDPPGAEMLSSEEQIDSFQHKFLEKQLNRADPDKVAAVKKAIRDAANKQRAQANNGLLLAADKVQSAIQEAERAIAQVDQRRSTDGSKEKNVASTVKAFGNIVAEAAVGGHDLQEMLDEQGARVDAREAVAPLRELAKSSANSDESEGKYEGKLKTGRNFKDERAPEAAAHAQERAAQNREAQQRELAQRTGDVLYPSVGPEEPEEAQPGDSSWNSKPAEL